MSDEHVSYKANFPGLTCKQPAPNHGPLWAHQQNAFRVVFFWQAESSRILRAYWELVDQFLSLHVCELVPHKSDLVYQYFSVNRDIHNM